MTLVGLPRAEVRGGGALWFVLVSIACALVAAYTAVDLVHAVRRVEPVVVARRVVPPLSMVTAPDLSVEDLPAAAVPGGAVRQEGAVVGRYTRMGFVPGEVVTAAAVSGGVAGATAFDERLAHLAGIAACTSGSTPPAPPKAGPGGTGGQASACRDLVAVSLPIDADQGYQLVRTGDRVDVAATYTIQSGTVSQVVASDVPVLFKADGSASGGGPALTASGPGSGLGALSGWLVLAATPDQALRMQLAESTGKVSVFLRPLDAPPEQPAVDQQLVTAEDLAGGAGGAAVPPALAGQLP